MSEFVYNSDSENDSAEDFLEDTAFVPPPSELTFRPKSGSASASATLPNSTFLPVNAPMNFRARPVIPPPPHLSNVHQQQAQSQHFTSPRQSAPQSSHRPVISHPTPPKHYNYPLQAGPLNTNPNPTPSTNNLAPAPPLTRSLSSDHAPSISLTSSSSLSSLPSVVSSGSASVSPIKSPRSAASASFSYGQSTPAIPRPVMPSSHSSPSLPGPPPPQRRPPPPRPPPPSSPAPTAVLSRSLSQPPIPQQRVLASPQRLVPSVGPTSSLPRSLSQPPSPQIMMPLNPYDNREQQYSAFSENEVTSCASSTTSSSSASSRTSLSSSSSSVRSSSLSSRPPGFTAPTTAQLAATRANLARTQSPSFSSSVDQVIPPQVPQLISPLDITIPSSNRSYLSSFSRGDTIRFGSGLHSQSPLQASGSTAPFARPMQSLSRGITSSASLSSLAFDPSQMIYELSETESDEQLDSEESYESDDEEDNRLVYSWVDTQSTAQARHFWKEKENTLRSSSLQQINRIGTMFQQWFRQGKLPDDDPFAKIYFSLSEILSRAEGDAQNGTLVTLSTSLVSPVRDMKNILVESWKKVQENGSKKQLTPPNLEKLDFHCQSFKLLCSVNARYQDDGYDSGSVLSAIQSFIHHLKDLFNWYVSANAAVIGRR